MALIPIQIPSGSSNVSAVDYDQDRRELWVTFFKGKYVYSGVSQGVADGFVTSGLTAGDYFRANVLNQFPYQRMG